MTDLADGETFQMQGSASKPYELKNTGGVYSCSCPAWRNQSISIEKRTCKHLRKLRGDAAEDERVTQAGGSAAPVPRKKTAAAAAPGAAPDDDEGPPLLLAERWDSVQDMTGWWMSEKLDGVRAYWDGKAFISRLGNPYYAPDWFVERMPDTPLDGELWGGRKLFQQTVSIVRRQDKSDHWKKISYLVFDAPSLDASFEDRLARCRELVERTGPPHAQVHPHEICRGLDHLRTELARVEGLGGEGLMLRKPGSKYVVGRSSTLLKVKNFYDAEARVVDHVAGEGRHTGRLGAVVVEMADGKRFSVGTGFSDAERASPPPVGAVITYRYQELSTGGVPRFPSFVAVRHDVKMPARAPAAAAVPAPPAVRRLEDEARFWEIEVKGAEYAVRSGPIGGAGTTRSKTLPDAATAQSVAEELIDEKRADGYREVAATPAAPAPAARSARRRFELSDGDSNKFWEVEVSGREVTVRYGRIGADGQTKTKSFADAAAAQREAGKLVAEKTEKGYAEVTGAAPEAIARDDDDGDEAGEEE